MLKILFATSELHPLIKTGGLADVAASLPHALAKLGHEVHIVIPAYHSVVAAAQENELKKIAEDTLDDQQLIIWQTHLPGTRIKVWLVDLPSFSQRQGNPYCEPSGYDWPDNAKRFYDFCRVTYRLAKNDLALSWQADIVHCNDWQTGLVPALLSLDAQHPPSLFTIHNLAYRGIFPRDTFFDLQLPNHWWHSESLEFYDQLAFMKGGLVYADYITTVSPSYALEIQTPEQGWGLDGLLRHRRHALQGILNGIDSDEWNPDRDKHLAKNYTKRSLQHKPINKTTLQEHLGLRVQADIPLLGFIGRMVDQKGVDLILAVLPQLLEEFRCQCVVLGSGMAHYEQMFRDLSTRFPESLSVIIGYDEALAHQIEAGADIFLMPSAYEPCGLNQMYSLRYGTLPVVHAVGGLRDTVKDFPEHPLDTANGFTFTEYSAPAFYLALERALTLFADNKSWRALQRNGMSGDFSWQQSAHAYVEVYEKLLIDGK